MPRLPLRRNNVPLIVLLVFVSLGVTSVIKTFDPSARPDFRQSRSVYHFENGIWTPTPQQPGGIDGLHISQTGAVWTAPASRYGLSRLSGGRWTRYEGIDMGVPTNWVRGGFTLSADELWGATDMGVIHFDGQSWHAYPEALKTSTPAAIVAGDSGVWVVDEYGNLSHFDGKSWSIRNLTGDLDVVPRSDGQDWNVPDLVMTAGGTPWIWWHGLWQQEGGHWRELKPAGIDLKDAALLGQDADQVWFELPGEIVAVTAEGRVRAHYGIAGAGVSKHAQFYRIAASGGRIWLATGSGLMVFDRNQWTNAGQPPGTVAVTDVAPGEHGSVWVVGESQPLASIVWWLMPSLGGGGIALAVIGLLVARWVRGRTWSLLASRQALANAAGPLPGIDLVADRAEAARQFRVLRWLPLILAASPLVLWPAIYNISLLGRQTDVSKWMVFAVPAALAMLAFAFWTWTSRPTKPAQTSEPEWEASSIQTIIWRSGQATLFLAALYFLLGPVWFPRTIPNRQAAGFTPVGGLILFVLIFPWRSLAAQYLVQAAWKSADYGSALKRLRRLWFGNPTIGMLYLKALTLSLAGRPAEAEQFFRLALARGAGRPAAEKTQILGGLGEILSELGRYEEGRRCLESAVQMGDRHGVARMGIAESLLLQRTEPQKALDLIDVAMGLAEGQIRERLEGGRWAQKAWALALLGRRHEALEAIARSLQARDLSMRAASAARHWMVGMALLAMESTGDAVEHFRKARDLDSQGKYGNLAVQQLKLHSA